MREWKLHDPDGYVFTLRDVAFTREIVDAPDCDDPSAPCERIAGGLVITATVVDDDLQAAE